MNFLHFIVYAHRNKLLKVKSWLLSSHFFSNVIDDVSSRQVARAQPTQPPPSQSHSNVDVSFLILPQTNYFMCHSHRKYLKQKLVQYDSPLNGQQAFIFSFLF